MVPSLRLSHVLALAAVLCAAALAGSGAPRDALDPPVAGAQTPVFSISGPTALTFAENTPATTVLANYTTANAGGAVTWELGGTHSGYFSISDAGALTFARNPNYESTTSLSVSIRANDTVIDSNRINLTVTITNVVEDPELSCTRYASSMAENSVGISRGYIAYCAHEDPEHDGFDRETDGSWALSGNDGSLFVIEWVPSDRDWEVKFRSAPDFEAPQDHDTDNEYEVTVTFTSETGNRSSSWSFTVTVTDVSEPPTVTGPASVTYGPIASRQVATYSAVDEDGTAVNSWSLPAGGDNGKFAISNTGVLTFSAQPSRLTAGDADANFAYQVTVRSTDGSNRTRDYPVTVRVNRPPQISEALFTMTVPENHTGDTGSFTSKDLEGDAITWSVGGTDGAHFRFTGAINLGGGSWFNGLSFRSVPEYELPAGSPHWDANTDHVYNINVVVSDRFGPRSYPATVTVTNVNEAPTVSGRTALTREEGSSLTVASYSATDPEGATIQWSLGGADAADFSITTAGVLTFAAAPDTTRRPTRTWTTSTRSPSRRPTARPPPRRPARWP